MKGKTPQDGRQEWTLVGTRLADRGIRHVREQVLASAALQMLNGEAPVLKASTQAHLARCVRCAARLEDLRAVMAGEREAVVDAADAAFADARLRAQRTAILDRLARDRASARVLRFPATETWTARSWIRRDRPAMRWLAGAAAAGLLVGLGAGQIAFTGRQLHLTPSASSARAWTPSRWLGQATAAAPNPARIERLTPASEEEFLSEMEVAINRRRNAALRALSTDLAPRPTRVSHQTTSVTTQK